MAISFVISLDSELNDNYVRSVAKHNGLNLRACAHALFDQALKKHCPILHRLKEIIYEQGHR